MKDLDVVGTTGGKATTEVVKPPVFPPNREVREGDLTSVPVKPRVEVGDRMRFSVGLLRQIYERPEHTSELVELIEVHIEADGAKLLVLKRCDR
jgi:hypothetical protein